jgi:hypothetical protein
MAVGRSGKGLAFGPAARRTVAGWGAQGGCPRLFRTGLVRLPAVRGPCLGQPAARAPQRAYPGRDLLRGGPDHARGPDGDLLRRRGADRVAPPRQQDRLDLLRRPLSGALELRVRVRDIRVADQARFPWRPRPPGSRSGSGPPVSALSWYSCPSCSRTAARLPVGGVRWPGSAAFPWARPAYRAR